MNDFLDWYSSFRGYAWEPLKFHGHWQLYPEFHWATGPFKSSPHKSNKAGIGWREVDRRSDERPTFGRGAIFFFWGSIIPSNHSKTLQKHVFFVLKDRKGIQVSQNIIIVFQLAVDGKGTTLDGRKKLLKFFVSSHVGRSLKKIGPPKRILLQLVAQVAHHACLEMADPSLKFQALRAELRQERQEAQEVQELSQGFLEFLNIFDGISRVANFNLRLTRL